MDKDDDRYRSWIGRQVTFRERRWVVIEYLEDAAALVLQARDRSALQSNRHGEAHRRVPETLTIPINDPSDQEMKALLDELQSDSN